MLGRDHFAEPGRLLGPEYDIALVGEVRLPGGGTLPCYDIAKLCELSRERGVPLPAKSHVATLKLGHCADCHWRRQEWVDTEASEDEPTLALDRFCGIEDTFVPDLGYCFRWRLEEPASP